MHHFLRLTLRHFLHQCLLHHFLRLTLRYLLRRHLLHRFLRLTLRHFLHRCLLHRFLHLTLRHLLHRCLLHRFLHLTLRHFLHRCLLHRFLRLDMHRIDGRFLRRCGLWGFRCRSSCPRCAYLRCQHLSVRTHKAYFPHRSRTRIETKSGGCHRRRCFFERLWHSCKNDAALFNLSENAPYGNIRVHIRQKKLRSLRTSHRVGRRVRGVLTFMLRLGDAFDVGT